MNKATTDGLLTQWSDAAGNIVIAETGKDQLTLPKAVAA